MDYIFYIDVFCIYNIIQNYWPNCLSVNLNSIAQYMFGRQNLNINYTILEKHIYIFYIMIQKKKVLKLLSLLLNAICYIRVLIDYLNIYF